jgi:hypothetical protein
MLLISILVFPFLIFFLCIFATRFYMIWQANTPDHLNASFLRIFLSCLKFWDSGLLIKAYFGNSVGATGRRESLMPPPAPALTTFP